jgi:hypothetical protein
MPIKVHVGPIDVGVKISSQRAPCGHNPPPSLLLSPVRSTLALVRRRPRPAAANRPPRGLSGINPNCCGKPVKPLGKPIQFSVTGLNPN